MAGCLLIILIILIVSQAALSYESAADPPDYTLHPVQMLARSELVSLRLDTKHKLSPFSHYYDYLNLNILYAGYDCMYIVYILAGVVVLAGEHKNTIYFYCVPCIIH